MFHAYRTFKKRGGVAALGPTYNKLLADEASQYVSVIITCYNYAEYVEEAIQSALKQTVEPLEIIVINDGSTDNSLDTINKYKGRVKIIDKPNEGVVAAKNQGLMEAKGEWIVYLDADDVLEPTYIEKTLHYAREHNYDVVYTDMKYFGVKDSLHKVFPFSFGRLLNGNFVHNSSLYKKTKLHQAGGYKDAMRGGYEDWEINISLHEKGAKFGYLPKPPLHYRQHEQEKGRNNEAQKKADALVATVHRLHRRSYLSGSLGFYKIKRGFIRVYQYPLLPFVALIYLPVAILKAGLAALWRFKSAWAYDVKHYIHVREQRKNRLGK
jgi:glycosyltransferase involved in cell wall biosynthesis